MLFVFAYPKYSLSVTIMCFSTLQVIMETVDNVKNVYVFFRGV